MGSVGGVSKAFKSIGLVAGVSAELFARVVIGAFVASAVVFFTACEDASTPPRAEWVINLDLLNEESFEIEAFIGEIKRASTDREPSKAEMLSIASILRNALALSQAHHINAPCFPRNSELYGVMDRYLEGHKEWRRLRDESECIAVAAVIEILDPRVVGRHTPLGQQ